MNVLTLLTEKTQEATQRQHTLLTVMCGLLPGLNAWLWLGSLPHALLDAALGATVAAIAYYWRENLTGENGAPYWRRVLAGKPERQSELEVHVWDSRRDWQMPAAATLCLWSAAAIAWFGPYAVPTVIIPGLAVDHVRRDRHPYPGLIVEGMS